MKKKRDTRPKGILLVIFGIAAIAALVFIANMTPPTGHCVSGETIAYQCFDTQAEAIYYATGGKVNLPRDASQTEIHAALVALDAGS